MKIVALFMLISLFDLFVTRRSHGRPSEEKKKPNQKEKEVLSQPITSYNSGVGNTFVSLAGFSYCSLKQMQDKSCCASKLPYYKVIEVGQVDQDEYTYAILRNSAEKKLVITLTGTKSFVQLTKEFFSGISAMVQYGNAAEGMLVNGYFHNVFTLVKAKIQPVLADLFKNGGHNDYQVIFTGHSLGGAVATLFALDSALEKYVPVNKFSPGLITFGAPRVGNFYFANQVMKNVPVVFRVVRDGDKVAEVPFCKSALNLSDENLAPVCINKAGQSIFFADGKLYNPVVEDDNYYHIAGLILYNSEMKAFENCGRQYSEENENKKCLLTGTLNFDMHRIYFQKKVSAICAERKRFFHH